MSTPAETPVYVSASDPQKYRDQYKLIYPMASAELKAECGHTLGGMFWWFIDPLLSILVFYIAFSYILQSGGKEFIAFLCVGTLTWRWFQCSVLRGCGAILDAPHILHKIYIHKAVLVGVSLLADSFKFLVTLIPLFLLVILLGYPPSPFWIALPLVILTQAVLTIAVVALSAAITPFMPDLRNLLQHFLQLLIFVSGVFFDITLITPRLKPLVMLNPLTGIIQGYRDCLLYQTWPNFHYLGIVFALSLMVMGVAFALINHYDREYAKIC
ncbi:ABC transporter permease [Kiritimatiellota bacterium B12222]|nr:ABC transporter permease [Kiritimatiellota bacterium B12222]